VSYFHTKTLKVLQLNRHYWVVKFQIWLSSGV